MKKQPVGADDLLETAYAVIIYYENCVVKSKYNWINVLISYAINNDSSWSL